MQATVLTVLRLYNSYLLLMYTVRNTCLDLYVGVTRLNSSSSSPSFYLFRTAQVGPSKLVSGSASHVYYTPQCRTGYQGMKHFQSYRCLKLSLIGLLTRNSSGDEIPERDFALFFYRSCL